MVVVTLVVIFAATIVSAAVDSNDTMSVVENFIDQPMTIAAAASNLNVATVSDGSNDVVPVENFIDWPMTIGAATKEESVLHPTAGANLHRVMVTASVAEADCADNACMIISKTTGKVTISSEENQIMVTAGKLDVERLQREVKNTEMVVAKLTSDERLHVLFVQNKAHGKSYPKTGFNVMWDEKSDIYGLLQMASEGKFLRGYIVD